MERQVEEEREVAERRSNLTLLSMRGEVAGAKAQCTSLLQQLVYHLPTNSPTDQPTNRPMHKPTDELTT